MFGRKSRAEKLRKRAESKPFVPLTALAATYAGAKPLLERLLYDDDLRDNIRTFIESIRNILDELSDEDPADIVARLWDDDKLRRQVEAATAAAQAGSKRMRGEKVREGGSGKWLLLFLSAGVAFLFLNPRTGPEARRLARETYSALTSAE